MPAGDSLYFVDTNVLVYTLAGGDAAKQQRASAWINHLWQSGCGRLSWQVLHEFYWNGTRKLHAPESLVKAMVRALAQWEPVDTTVGLLEEGWNWCAHTQAAYWDGLILAAAGRCGARFLLSEDFQAGRRYGACTVLNPFSAKPPVA